MPVVERWSPDRPRVSTPLHFNEALPLEPGNARRCALNRISNLRQSPVHLSYAIIITNGRGQYGQPKTPLRQKENIRWFTTVSGSTRDVSLGRGILSAWTNPGRAFVDGCCQRSCGN